MILLKYIIKLNVILSVCGVLRIALYFCEFVVKSEFLEGITDAKVIEVAHLLAVEDKGLGQSFAMCLVLPLSSFKSPSETE